MTQTLLERIRQYNLDNGDPVAVFPGEPMSRHTTFRIGGPASLYLEPAEGESLAALLRMAKEEGVRTFLIGNGSNLLFDDGGFPGAVISTSRLDGIRVDGTLVTAGAGASLSAVCKAARDAALTGLEFAYGIPGSVGGAVVMNAGAYGGEIADVLETSEFLDPVSGERGTFTLPEHAYGYRDSVYKRNGRAVLSAAFRLTPGDREEIAARMNELAGRRVAKQPLEYPSAGSVFKRPEGHFVGQMVEESGLKGFRTGGAEVSEKHAGFIVNRGGASADDVLRLIRHIRAVILENYGVELECEIIHVK